MYTWRMGDLEIRDATVADTWWATGREFAYLPDVDPAFSKEHMGALRRMILRSASLPLSYQRAAFRWILLKDTRRAGYLYLRQRANSLMLDAMGIEAQVRRIGLGSRLVAKAKEMAQRLKLDFLTAVITPENLPGIAFLERHGFRPYRPQVFSYHGDDFRVSGQGKWGLRELAAVETLPAYEKWQKVAVQSGDAWAAGLILGAYLRQGWKGAARHWVCLIGSEETGYLRLAGLRGRYQAYIASKPGTWKLGAQVSWLKQAVEAYPSQLEHVSLDLAAHAHIEASREIWEAAGFRVLPKERYLMICSLKGKPGR